MLARSIALLVLASGAAAACAHEYKPELEQPVGQTHTTAARVERPAAATSASAAPAAPAETQADAGAAVVCQLPDTLERAIHFDPGSAKLDPHADETLRRLAECLTTGPLAGNHVCITGYADPRGPSGYNYDLALARGYAVMRALQQYGVPASRIRVGSRGASESGGTGPGGWSRERHVEVDLGELCPDGAPP